ncbi:hypothetical protein JB92DRAFT_3060262 [Gautieria morchelliformis]|nr:hypothetical protein JB92DRAFT_3060262 [Gautieria morchelliformis]
MSITNGSLYIAGFAQAGDPHAGLFIPNSGSAGDFFHIHVPRNQTSSQWTYQARQQNFSQSMTFTTLLRIHDASQGVITAQTMDWAAKQVAVPSGAEEGECLKWVMSVIGILQKHGLVRVSSISHLQQEFSQFAAGNRAYATRSILPNVNVSQYCT